MNFQKITEFTSRYNHLEKMSVDDLISNINKEDDTVAKAVHNALPQIKIVIEKIVEKMKTGGRLFYLGAGTSGRLGILDASECPPTFGVSTELIIGIIAGGSKAITSAIEFAEDDATQGWADLQQYNICDKDIVLGISASGTTPYVIAALTKCGENNIVTAGISCNPHAPLSLTARHIIEVIVGPEFITGSTRMKSGTAQKMVLNMISTSVMILQGHIEDNKMVHMELTNQKLIDRAVKIVMEKFLLDYQQAKKLLLQSGGLKNLFK